MKEIKLPTNTQCLAQVSNSFRRFLQLDLHHASDEKLDEWIQENKIEQLLVVLVDGLGYNQVQKYLPEDSFIRKHISHKVEAIYPTATVPSTTTIRTGKFPIQTGWLGWHQHVPGVDDHYVMYMNSGFYNEQSYSPKIKDEVYPMDLTVKEVKNAVELFPAWIDGNFEDLASLCSEAEEYLNKGTKYAYVYWDVYDHNMHLNGVDSKEALDELASVEQILQDVASRLNPHVGLVVLADHGHVNVEHVNINDYPQLAQQLRKKPGLECRCASLFVKDECLDTFKEDFNQVLGEQFYLLSKQEVLETNLFGVGQPHPQFENNIGDFICCSISNANLIYTNRETPLKGNHGGLTDDERYVPIITYCK